MASPSAQYLKTPAGGWEMPMSLTSQWLLLAESLQANTCDAHLGLPCSWALVKGPGLQASHCSRLPGESQLWGAQPVSIHQEMLGAAQGTQGRQERTLPSQPLCCPLAGPVGARTAAVSLGGVRGAGTAGLTCPPGCQA